MCKNVLMKKIAFITHSFHEITKSANVYIDAIFRDKEKYKIDIFYNDEWGEKSRYKKFDEKIENYDAVIILQLISFNLLKKINCKNIIFIPMYDYSRNHTIEKWLPAAEVKILSPVQAMSNELKLIGLNPYQFKYFPSVADYKKPNFEKVYFWNRVEKLNCKTVLTLLKNYNFSNLNIHTAHDPGNKPIMPSKRQVKNFNISFTEWFNSKEDYLKHLSSYGIYIAPRPFEGGAAAFIDAMKAGCVVIAPNHPPYNEYIENNINGFLYEFTNPKPIPFNQFNLELISKSAYESIKIGSENFNSNLENIHNYIFNEDLEINSSSYFENLEAVFEKTWFKFGNLTKKDKLIELSKLILSKFKKYIKF